MAVSKLVVTHVNGNDNVIILADGAEFVIIAGDKHTKKFTEADAAAFVKELTGINTAIKAAKLALGRSLQPKDKVVSVLCEDADLDEVTFQIVNTVVSAKVKDTWPMTVLTEGDVIDLPVGVVDDLLKYLLAEGVEKAPTADMYDKIVFVPALPEEAEEGVAYVLDKADGDKPANSAWLSVDDEWMELSDDEEAAENGGEEEGPGVVEGGNEQPQTTPGASDPAVPAEP